MDRTLLKTGTLLRHLTISALVLLITVTGVTLAHADSESDPGSAAEKSPLVPLATARVNDKGNQLQRDGKFEEAAQVYREEALRRPENGILQRNLAGALSRSEQLEEGLAAYSQAVRFADTRQEKAWALYDLGNALVLAGQAEQAMQTWASAMMLAPEDMDIKHNFEYLLKQQQEQNDDQDEGEQGDQEQDQQEQPDQNQKNQDQESQDQEQKQEQSEQEQQEQDQANPDESQQPQPSEEQDQMSEEDAKRLLDAMLEEEKELQTERNRKAQIRNPNVEKDW